MKRHTDITTQEVERMLQRFMDGMTTLEEEALLADFFRTHEVAGEWKAYKEMFQLFGQGEVEVKADRKGSRWWKQVGIAAAIVLLFSLGFFLFHTKQPEQPRLMVKTDTIKTFTPTLPHHGEGVPSGEEGKPDTMSKKKENVEKVDTVSKAKEIQKMIRPPKVYLASVTQKQKPQPIATKKVHAYDMYADVPDVRADAHAEKISEPEMEASVMVASPPPILPDEEDDLFMHLDYDEMKREIQKRGARLKQDFEIALIDDPDE